MTQAEFHAYLAARISPGEAECLRRGGEGLCISRFNAEVCRRLLDADGPGGGTVSQEGAASLEAALRDYLDQYLPDRPEGHKWIVLACLYLSFVERLPMHPREAVHWIERGGRYFCPAREPDGTVCRFCVCEGMEK